MRGQPFRDRFGILAMLLHPQRERLDARENHKGIEWRQRRTEVAQAKNSASDRKRKIPKCLLDLDAVIFRARLAQHWIFVVLRPIEGTGIDDDAAERIAMPAKKFRQGMHDNIGTMVDRPQQIGRRQGVVDDQR